MIEHIIIGMLYTWGIHGAFQTKHLLGKLGKAIEQIIGTVWVKPLFACPPCMGGFHGFLLAVFYFNLGLMDTLVLMIGIIGGNFIIKEFLYEDIQQEK